MAAIAWSDVSPLGAELANVQSSAQTLILGAVNTMLNVLMFDGESGPITKAARCYLAAHMAALAGLGAGGPLTTERSGELENQYAIPRGKSEYLTTSYGRMYFQLIRAPARGPK